MTLFLSVLLSLHVGALDCSALLIERVAPRTERLATSEIHPLQMEVGDAAVEKLLEGLRERGENLQAFLNKKKPLPAVVFPNFERRILDGHHRARFMVLAESRGWVAPDELTVEVEIVRDYSNSGHTLAEAMQELYEEGNIYLTKEVRELLKTGKISWDDVLRDYLPHRLEDLGNNPKRALIGIVFEKMRIDSSQYKNFIQFFVVEELEARGFEFPEFFDPTDPAIILAVISRMEMPDMEEFMTRNLLFTCPSSRKGISAFK